VSASLPRTECIVVSPERGCRHRRFAPLAASAVMLCFSLRGPSPSDLMSRAPFALRLRSVVYAVCSAALALLQMLLFAHVIWRKHGHQVTLAAVVSMLCECVAALPLGPVVRRLTRCAVPLSQASPGIAAVLIAGLLACCFLDRRCPGSSRWRRRAAGSGRSSLRDSCPRASRRSVVSFFFPRLAGSVCPCLALLPCLLTCISSPVTYSSRLLPRPFRSCSCPPADPIRAAQVIAMLQQHCLFWFFIHESGRGS
jgi:lysylphosphatidylglycerol synthetase-like protein (DUF2156 family)